MTSRENAENPPNQSELWHLDTCLLNSIAVFCFHNSREITTVRHFVRNIFCSLLPAQSSCSLIRLNNNYVPVKSKLQHPSPGHLNFWRLACSNSLPPGQKSRSNAPPIRSQVPLLKDKFCLQSNTVHTCQREMCHDDTFKLLLNTLLKELFTNKGEILSCKSIKPCKNWKKRTRVLRQN